MNRRILVVALLVVVSGLACTRQQLGLPRIHVEVTSPDGRFTAFVKNHLTVDPPDQSLWLQTPDGAKKRLRRLVADLDWCHVVVWSGDSSRVAFLIQDARLLVYNPFTSEVVLEKWLVDPPGGYPPHEKVRDLELSEDGSVATYRRCPRSSDTCYELESLNINDHRSQNLA